jgi:predicted dehydrogenase
MAIGVTSFERQFQDFAEAIRQHREPLVDGEEGYRALQVVLGIYQSCRDSRTVALTT